MSETEKKAQDTFDTKDFHYDYGNLPNMHPSGETSKIICKKLKERKEAAHAVLSRMYEIWRKVDQKKQLFVPLTSLERSYKSNDPSLPLATIVPYMVGALDTLKATFQRTYLRKTINHYEGFGSNEEIRNGILRERIIAEADSYFNCQLHVMSAFEECMSKGIAVLGTRWQSHAKYQPVSDEVTDLVKTMLEEQGVPGAMIGDYLESMSDEVEHEGTEMVPIDSWNLFIDPSVNFNVFNRSQYAGYLYETNPYDLLDMENAPNSRFFNCKNARMMATSNAGLDMLFRKDIYGPAGSMKVTGESTQAGPNIRERLQPCFWVQRLIPNEWGLGDGDKPETWQFQTIGDKLVIQAHPIDSNHKALGFCAMAPTTTGFDVVPLAMLARSYGFQESGDWIIRSRMHEVMSAGAKALYNPLFIDPDNFLSGRPRAAIPVRPAAYYREGPISNYFHELQFHDATQGHWGDLEALQKMAKDMDGTVEVMSGDMSSLPDRPGAGVANNAMSAATSRVAMTMRTTVQQSFKDMGYIKGCNLDQHMTTEQYVKARGGQEMADLTEMFGQDAVQVGIGPDHVKGRWRVVPADESQLNPDNAQAVQQLSSIFFQNPQAQAEVLSTYSPVKWLGWMLEQGGGSYARNLLRNKPVNPAQFGAGLMPDAQVEDQQAKGNIVPQAQAQQYLQRAR